MLRIIRTSRLGIRLVLGCAAFLWSEAFPQEAGNNAQQPITRTGSAPTIDFEVKTTTPPGNGFLVRRKGTLEWTESMKLSEPVAVGLLDGTSLIYVVSQAIKPPLSKYRLEPTYPESERKGKGGQVILRVVVDGKGKVRIPTVDSSPSPAFANATIEAVKKWKFEPAKLNGEPVAVLITIDMEFH